MVVHQKDPLELGQPVFGIPLLQQKTVDALGGEHRHFRPAQAVKGLFGGHGAVFQAGVMQRIQNALHRRVAGQVPQFRHPVLFFGKMPQHTVKNDVEIGAVAQHPAPEIPLSQKTAVVVQRLSVGGKGQGYLSAGPETQAAQRRVQIGQVEIQLAPGGKENALSDLVKIPGRGHCLHLQNGAGDRGTPRVRLFVSYNSKRLPKPPGSV